MNDNCLVVTLNPSLGYTFFVSCLELGRINRLEEPATEWVDGKGLITASADSRYMRRCHSFFPAGGETGRRLISLLNQHAISFDAFTISGTTRRTYSVNDYHDQLCETHILEPGPPLTPQEIAKILSEVQRLATSRSIVAFCGSVPSDLIPSIGSLVRLLHRDGKKIFVDTSGSALLEFLRAGVDYVKINGSEFYDAIGKQGDANTATEVLQKYNLNELIITRGTEPALSVAAEGTVLQTEFLRIDTRNTVGCGDSFNAGFLSNLDTDRVERMRRACVLGGLNAMARIPGEIDISHFPQLYDNTTCVEV